MFDAPAFLPTVALVAALAVYLWPWLSESIRHSLQSDETTQEGAFPVYSAETSWGTEAEYVNDPLAQSAPQWLKLVAFVALVAASADLIFRALR
jgi:hypothetical protein